MAMVSADVAIMARPRRSNLTGRPPCGPPPTGLAVGLAAPATHAIRARSVSCRYGGSSRRFAPSAARTWRITGSGSPAHTRD